jgi:hypothetical protein
MRILIVQCDESCARELSQLLSRDAVPNQASQRRNIEGDIAVWVVTIGLTVRMLPAILSSIKDLLRVRRIEKITVGDIEITQPRPQDVDRIIDKLSGPHTPSADADSSDGE